MSNKELHLIGCASGLAGADAHSGDGPIKMQTSPFLAELSKRGVAFKWDAMIMPMASSSLDQSIRELCVKLAKKVSESVRNQDFFSVVGGDHSCAIGTWSGVYDALHDQGEIGLIWIDAHMDSHTPETSQSMNIHGMPVASLLGHGYSSLTSILHDSPKLKPENVCLIGVRSFEKEEAEFLKNQNVRVYFMDEVKQRGIAPIMREAVEHVTRHTIGYGISFDLDSIDPIEAPGVDVPEPDGIRVKEFLEAIGSIVKDPRLIATEIVEFDPLRDKNHLTEKLAVKFLEIIAKGKQ